MASASSTRDATLTTPLSCKLVAVTVKPRSSVMPGTSMRSDEDGAHHQRTGGRGVREILSGAGEPMAMGRDGWPLTEVAARRQESGSLRVGWRRLRYDFSESNLGCFLWVVECAVPRIARNHSMPTSLMFRAFCQILLLLFALLTASHAWAACAGSGVSSIVTLPASLTIGRDLPIGSVLYDTGWVGSSSASISCPAGESWYYGYTAAMTAVPAAGTGVYQTNVPGIGVRTGWSNALGTRPADITQATIQNWPRYSNWLPNYAASYTPASLYRVQLIKTGSIGSGNISFPSPIATSWYGGIVATQVTFTSTQVNVTTAGCTVTNSNIIVNLPNARMQNFSGIGSTQGATSFSIPLSCDAGVSVAYRLDGTADPSNAPGVLANQAGSGMATGVGVQVLQGSTPVTLGAVSPTFIHTTQANQAVSIPMTAQYYKTNAVTVAGNVNAFATLNMNYQ